VLEQTPESQQACRDIPRGYPVRQAQERLYAMVAPMLSGTLLLVLQLLVLQLQ
jgi:hypothetical protein